MEPHKFEAMLILILPQVIKLIAEWLSMYELAASKEFYNSEVYFLLEEEDTKLWYLSALTLFTMFQEEKETGTISFPEEA